MSNQRVFKPLNLAYPMLHISPPRPTSLSKPPTQILPTPPFPSLISQSQEQCPILILFRKPPLSAITGEKTQPTFSPFVEDRTAEDLAPTPVDLALYQVILHQPYSSSGGAFPFLFSSSISRFAVASSSSDGMFTIIRYMTFWMTEQISLLCSSPGQSKSSRSNVPASTSS